jgi:hypothetical protein
MNWGTLNSHNTNISELLGSLHKQEITKGNDDYVHFDFLLVDKKSLSRLEIPNWNLMKEGTKD